MATARQKIVLVGELGNFMLDRGKLLTGREYRALGTGPLRWASMKRLFGNWNRTMRFLEQSHPELWEKLNYLGTKPKSTKAEAPSIDLSAIEEDDVE
jgi:hypothetical protein